MDNNRLLFVVVFSLAVVWFNTPAQQYFPTWESLDRRPVAPWFGEAKFGIFIHWGPYSVPAYRPAENGHWDGIYAEWYGPDVMYKPWRNDSFHIRQYGRDFEYRDFGKLFRAELWDPHEWANIVANSGARYVVFTTKHSDGFCNWPTQDPVSRGWNSGDNGPRRDLTGELTQAIRARGLKMGFYYSWLEYENMDSTLWPHNPALKAERTGYYLPKEVFDRYTIGDKAYIEHCHFQIKELVNNYQPDLLWGDATWDRPAEYWQSRELLTWLFNEAPNKNEIVINDRWDNTEKKHGGYVTTEYGSGSESLEPGRPWEECQGIGYSFGYNRAENLDQYKTSDELVHLLIRTVAEGGNLLLNIGPAADGTIPVIMQQRLADMGKWLKVNGEAIYSTTKYRHLEALQMANPEIGKTLFVTWHGKVLYLFDIRKDATDLRLVIPDKQAPAGVVLLGSDSPVAYRFAGGVLTLPSACINLPYARTYKIEYR